MISDLLLLIVSLVLLVGGAEVLVRGAVRLALRLGVSAFVVGVTVVGFGTSAPELAASLGSATSGHPSIAIGNVVGSNIMNIALVLGLTALIRPIPISKNLVRRQTIVVILVSLLPFAALLTGGWIGRWMGTIYVALLVVFLIWTWRTSRSEGGAPEEVDLDDAAPPRGTGSIALDVVFVVVGIGLLVYGADLLVRSASDLARSFGVSELVIGLTIVAGGTSAPELMTSVVATLRGKADLSVGNILGSCVFNILGILGITAIVVPLEIPSSVFMFDLPFMVLLAVACLPIFFSSGRISRVEGGILVGVCVVYLVSLYVYASEGKDEAIQPPPITWRPS